MVVKDKKSLWSQATNKAWKKFVLAVMVLIGLLLILWGVAEIGYQQHINTLKSEVQKAEQDVIKPAGGVSFKSNLVAPHWLDQFGCIDNGPCPRVDHIWFVLVDPNKEDDLMSSVLQKEGYTGRDQSGIVYADKNKFEMRLEVTPLGSNQPPYAASAGKEWRLMSVSLYDRK